MRSKKEIPVEEKSYSALFFILSALLGFVTLWGFWNEAITRRPWKAIQQRFYQYEYEKTKIALEGAQKELPEIETPEPLDAKRLSKLEQNINDATIKLDEALQERKFLQSEADAINYKYQFALHHSKAIHEKGDKSDPEVDKWKSRLDEFDRQIEGKLTQDVVAAERTLADAYLESASFYEAGGHIEDALSQFLLVQKYDPASETLPAKIKDLRLQVESIRADRTAKAEVDKLEEKLSSLSPLKRSFLGSLLESPFHKTRSLVQYYLEDFEYTADRCATCHFSVDRSGYDRFAAESFEVEGGEDGQTPSKQLMHPLVKVGSESVLIDDEEAESDQYVLNENGLLTFVDPDIADFGAEVEIEYETGYDAVLRTHPYRDVLLGNHPVERFGCTPCHGGQGQALTAQSAHALTHAEFWLEPVLGLDEHTSELSGQLSRERKKGKRADQHRIADLEKELEEKRSELRGYLYTNCRRCHSEVMMLDYPSPPPETADARDYAPDLSKGMALFEDLGCQGCHAVDGYPALEKLANVGPSLAKIGSKVNGTEWLVGWLKDPPSYLPDTKMPVFFPTEDMSKLVYLKNGMKREGTVRSEAGAIIVRTDDGTEYPYREDEVDRIVDIVKSIAAYLEQQTDAAIDGIEPNYSTSPKAIAAGEETVKSVGCIACHAVDGLGSDFAPNLDDVGNKLTPNFLRQWVDNPKSYDPDTVMPDMRLSDTEVDNVVAYLMSLKSPESPAVKVAADSYGNIVEEIDSEEGETLVRLYGCFGCHTIPGFEDEPKVGAELSAFGSKTVDEFDFGDSVGIEHSWHGWTIGKLTDPRRYQTRRIIQRMPVFPIGQEDAYALAVLLKSFQAKKYPLSYIHQPSDTLRSVDAGRRLVKKYNCQGCHEIEAKGGEYVEFIDSQRDDLDLNQAKQFAPPTLRAEGAKVHPDWLFSFLKEPTLIRYGLDVRMPTFGFSDEETTALVQYFSALSDEPFPYETIPLPPTAQADLRVGKQIFDALQCISCHPEQGEVIPAGSDKTGRPDLSLAKGRLKEDWLIDWMKDPAFFQPGTAMPQAWPKIGGVYQPVDGFAIQDAEEQIRLVRDYLLSLSK